MNKFILLTLFILSSNVAFAVTATSADCGKAVSEAVIKQYDLDNAPYGHDALTDNLIPTRIESSGLTAYVVPLYQKMGTGHGCGIGQAYVVLVDDQCVVRSTPVPDVY